MNIRSGRDEGAQGLVEAVVEEGGGRGGEALKVSQRAKARSAMRPNPLYDVMRVKTQSNPVIVWSALPLSLDVLKSKVQKNQAEEDERC